MELMSHRGVEGTVLGTLFMPYFSGLSNFISLAVALVHLICIVLLRGLPKLVTFGLNAVAGYTIYTQIDI